MGDGEDFFDAIYTLTEPHETAAHYARFASRYETAMAENGYVTPARCAAALAEIGADFGVPVLDLGCGSGLSGMALHTEGFQTIDGTDFSEEMLALAREKGIYRDLWQADLSQPAQDRAASYMAIVAAGVLNPAHVPAEAIDHILEMLQPGGLFVFSLNDHAIAAGGYNGRLNNHIDGGQVELLKRDYGEHMPGQGLKAFVYALRKR